LKHEAEEVKAETARLSSFVGAVAIGDLVKSTLGPKGMDKILVSHGRTEGQVMITNDGATILKAVGVDNPAAKILVDMSRVQDDEVGDGTTSVAVLGKYLNYVRRDIAERQLKQKRIVYVCKINQHHAVFIFTLLNYHACTCFGPICSPSSGGSKCICGKWYLFFF
jgi:T-complex protein 1 subunit beta